MVPVLNQFDQKSISSEVLFIMSKKAASAKEVIHHATNVRRRR